MKVFLSIAVILAFGSHAALAQQKAKAADKPRYKTYEECVADKKATGWSSTEYGSWCSKNSGR